MQAFQLHACFIDLHRLFNFELNIIAIWIYRCL